MAIFDEFDFGDELFGSGTDPDEIVRGRVAWIFYDGNSTYQLPVNPNSASMPEITHKITARATASGGQILTKGRREPGKIRFSGVILSEAQYRNFRSWITLRKQIRITDDLGENYWVYLTSFSPTRTRSSDYPWFMDYSVDGFVLSRGSI